MMKIDDRTIYAAMITHPGRDALRKITCNSLARATPRLHRDLRVFRNQAPVGEPNHHANVAAVLREFRASHRPYLLFMEDDLEFHPMAFGVCLTETLRTYPGSLWNFCLIGRHGLPKKVKAMLKKSRWTDGFFQMPAVVHRRDYFGSQCFLMSRRFVDELCRSGVLESMKPKGWRGEGERMHFDNAVATHCRDLGTKMNAWWPNPVQHTGIYKTWTDLASRTPNSLTYPYAVQMHSGFNLDVE